MGIDEGAKLVLDGRNHVVEGYENGFYLGPTIFDHVKPGMSIGDTEIFGPVLAIKRVKDFEEGLAIMNANPFASGICNLFDIKRNLSAVSFYNMNYHFTRTSIILYLVFHANNYILV